MKIVRYVVKDDTGLAPNPFHGWCTLAVCTPNHQGARVEKGDWIVGNSEKPKGKTDDDRQLIYAMRVERVMNINDYFDDKDEEFLAKKPNPYGCDIEQRGDNFYELVDEQAKLWRRLPSMFHNEPHFFFKDLGKNLDGCEVFAGREFFYFGENRIDFPPHFKPLIAKGRGVRTYGETDINDEFVEWLKKEYPSHHTGRILREKYPSEDGRIFGMPKDFINKPAVESMVTAYSFVYEEPRGKHPDGSCNPNTRRSGGCL